MIKKLKIAQIAPIIIPTPPETRGGTEKIASDLTEQLVKMGHDVTLFATGDSKTKAKLRYIFKKSLIKMPGWGFWPKGLSTEYTLAHLCEAFSFIKKNDFDIVHVHFNDMAFHFQKFLKIPTLVTYHNPIKPEFHKLFNQLYKNYCCVSISNSQRKDLKGFVATIPKGLNLNEIPFSEKKDDYLITAGRIVPEKGIKESIEIAKKLNKRLIIVGRVFNNIKKSREYYNKHIKKHIDQKNIILYQNVKHDKLMRLFSRAETFIFPLQGEEAFGLVLIEAMACGTPAIALKKEAVPEIIKHGYSGYIAKNMQEMVKFTKMAKNLKPKDCRDHVAKNFSIEKIAKKYLAVYYRAIKQNKNA